MLHGTKSRLTEKQIVALSSVARTLMDLPAVDALEVLLIQQSEFIMQIQFNENKTE